MNNLTSSEYTVPALDPAAVPTHPVVDVDRSALVHSFPKDESGSDVENADPLSAFNQLSDLCAQIKNQYQSFLRVYRRSFDEAIALGELLDQAKKITLRGQWTTFLGEVGIGERPAQNYMQLYRRREVILAAGTEFNSGLTISRALAAARQPRVVRPVATKSAGADSAAAEAVEAFATTSLDTHSDKLGESCTSASNLDARVDENINPTRPVDAEVGDLDQDQEGHLLADGSRLPTSVYDKGPLAFEHVQIQLDALKHNNERARSDLQRGCSSIVIEQQCIVELARAANRLFEFHATTDEQLAQTLMNAIVTVRNLFVSLVPTSSLTTMSTMAARRDMFGRSQRYTAFDRTHRF